MDVRLSDAVFAAPAAPTLGGPGPLLPVPAQPKPRTARVRVTAEVVGVRAALGGYYTSMPPWIDDLTREFGPDLYDRMQLDDQVSSSLRALCHGVLSDELVLRPGVDDRKDPDFGAAKDALGFCERATWQQTGGLDQWLLAMLKGAVGGGNRVSETVYRPEESGKDAGRWVLGRLKVKPRRNVGFAVDSCNNLAGFLAVLPGGESWGGPAWGTTFDPADPPDNFVPRDKFCALAWDPPDEDPRGSALLRCVYEPWWAKLQAAREWLAYLAQFGSPSLVGTTAPGADSSAPTDAYGNPVAGDVLTPEQDMANKVVEFRNGGVFIIPAGATLNILQTSNAGDAFLKKVDSCDRAIAQGINLAMRAVMQSRFGSRADAEQGQDVAGLQTRFMKRWLARMVTEDLLRNLVRVNYGPDAARRLCPYASLSPVEHQDLGPSLVAVSGAWKNGLIKNSQLPWVYEQFGMPPATPEELAAPPPGSAPPGPPGGPDDGSGDARHPLAQALLAQGHPPGGSAPFADDAGGHWVTLEDDQHVFISGGGEVLATRGQIAGAAGGGGAGADPLSSALGGAKPRTVDQLVKATGLPRDEVSRRLNVLLGQGRLERTVVRGKSSYSLKGPAGTPAPAARQARPKPPAAPATPAPRPAVAAKKPSAAAGAARAAVARVIAEDPEVRAGGLGQVRDLRDGLGWPREEFDHALVGLIRDGVVTPHLVDSPGQWTDAERAQFLAIPVAEAHAMGLHALEGAAYEGKTYYFQSVAVNDPDRLREASVSGAAPFAFDPDQPRVPAGQAGGGEWGSGGGGPSVSPVPPTALARYHHSLLGYIADNGPAPAGELAGHLGDRHRLGAAKARAVVEHLAAQGDLARGTDEYGRAVLDRPAARTPAPRPAPQAAPPRAAPARVPAPAPPAAGREQREEAAVLAEVRALLPAHPDGMVPIARVRRAVAARYGAAAAGPALDDALLRLRYDDRVRLIVASDLSALSPEDRAGSIQGVGELFHSVSLPETAAPFSADAPDLSGLGGLFSLSRQEVLDALFDAALDSFDLALPDAAFGGPGQPRVPAGSPEGGEWASGGGAGVGETTARWEKEDRQSERRQEKESEGLEERQQGEWSALSEARDREDAATEKRRDREDSATQRQRDREDAREEAKSERAAQRAKDREDAASFAREKATPTYREWVRLDREYGPGSKESQEAWRRHEDATGRPAEDARLQKVHEQIDRNADEYVDEWRAGREKVHAQEDAARKQARAAEDAATAARRDAEDEPVRARHEQEQQELAARHEAEDAEVYGRRRADHPAAHAAHYDTGDAPFYSPDQPRVPAGRPGGGRWVGGVSPGTAAARDAASDAVRAFASGQGPPTAAEAQALAGHLARLTVAQIHALKAEHGLKGSAPSKAALVAKLAGRFAAWRTGRAPREAVPDWPEGYDVFGKRDVFADEPVDPGTLAPTAEGPEAAAVAPEPVVAPAGKYDVRQAEYGGMRQLIFRQGGKEVGEVMLRSRPDGNYEVGNVLVFPDFRRKGHGTEFYRYAAEQAHAEGKKLFISDDRSEYAKALHGRFKAAGVLGPDGEIDFAAKAAPPPPAPPPAPAPAPAAPTPAPAPDHAAAAEALQRATQEAIDAARASVKTVRTRFGPSETPDPAVAERETARLSAHLEDLKARFPSKADAQKLGRALGLSDVSGSADVIWAKIRSLSEGRLGSFLRAYA